MPKHHHQLLEMKKKKFSCRNHRAMTLMEILLVVSLVSIINIALYSALVNGLKVWEKSRRLVGEEDIVLFLDKISQDLRNAFAYSKIQFNGNEQRFAFPAMVRMPADPKSGLPADQYVNQMGQVEYYFDKVEKKIFRHQANYGQALRGEYSHPVALVNGVEGFAFQYVYLTDNEEIVSDEVLEKPPAGVNIELHSLDGERSKNIRKLIAVPVGG